MSRLLVSLLAAGALLSLPCTAAAQYFELSQPAPCQEFTPSAVGIQPDQPTELRVAVVLDEVSTAAGRAIYSRVAKVYEPHGISIRPTFLLADLPEGDPETMMSGARQLFSGRRPPWAHLVQVLTSDRLGGMVLGQADCIGALPYEDRAFAVAHVTSATPRFGAEVAAHELGHLLGAIHEHANCAEGTNEEPVRDSCTLMFPDASATSLVLSTVNAALVRGQVQAYAEPLTAVPPADGTALTDLPEAQCSQQIHADPPGDSSNPGGPPAVDLLRGDLEFTHEMVTYRWTVAAIDAVASPLGTRREWRFHHMLDGKELYLSVVAGDDGNVIGRVVEGSTVSDPDGPSPIPVEASVTPGTPGVVQARLPYPVGTRVALGNARAFEGVEDPAGFKTLTTYDSASSTAIEVALAPCPPAAPHHDIPAGGASEKRRLLAPAARIPQRSVRRIGRSLRVIVKGSARSVRLRLIGTRGGVLGRGQVRRLRGRAVVRMRVPAALRPGVHVLEVTAAGRSPRMVRVRLRP